MALLRHFSVLLRLRLAPLVLVLLAVTCGQSLPAQNEDRELNLKAVFLFNFCQFMDWPADSFDGASSPITIGVVGGNPFGSRLHQTVEGEVVRGRNIRVEFYQRPSQARCHILFFSNGTPRPDDLAELHRRNIVTIGESESFISSGGMIALISAGNRVNLRINLSAVRSTRIEVSSKLLRVANVSR